MSTVEAFFLGAGADRRFAVCWQPSPGIERRGGLLFVPPFAEEMNKSRRMVALAAQALAQRGFVVLRLDLAGCGDSGGQLEQTRWDDWIADLHAGWRWLRGHADPVHMWSLRAGALLAQATQPHLPAFAGHVLWQPVLSGKQHLTQFLRLRVAADAFAIADPAARASTSSLMAALHAGEVIDVAGYRLPPAIALPLATSDLTAPSGSMDAHWLEVSAAAEPAVAPASQDRIAQWQMAGRRVTSCAVSGPPFWSTQEIEDCPALISATVDALCPTR